MDRRALLYYILYYMVHVQRQTYKNSFVQWIQIEWKKIDSHYYIIYYIIQNIIKDKLIQLIIFNGNKFKIIIFNQWIHIEMNNNNIIILYILFIFGESTFNYKVNH